ncbi:MAG: hypothetical protein KatS3mg051_0145 [Anaerolineae bacterium]|nr:MAG: hypothetical protein KatS3mg051_0145 [Anaerolineae bacterium]
MHGHPALARSPSRPVLLLALACGVLTDAWIGREVNFSEHLVALPAVFLLVGVGLQSLWQWLHGREVARAWQPVTALVAVIVLVNVWTVRARLFDDWRHDPAVRTAYHSDWRPWPPTSTARPTVCPSRCASLV